MNSSSKAMKLLGLSKLPPDASPAEHQALIRQHRSVRLERAKSCSPDGLQLENSLSSMRSESFSSATIHAREKIGDPQVQAIPEKDSGGEQDTEEYDPLNVRESPLRLTAADVDDDFINMITDIMSQFPEPPTRSPATDSSSSMSSNFGRMKWVDRRGISDVRPRSWRAGRGAGEEEKLLPPPIERQHAPFYHFEGSPQEAYNATRAGGRAGAYEIDAPRVRIKYNTDEDFAL